MKNILVFGGLGFIGSNIASYFAKYGHDVTIFDNLDSHSGGSIKNIDKSLENIRIVFHDILNFDRVVEFASNADIIINCAASTSHQYSMREPLYDLDVNTRGVLHVLEAIKRYNPSAYFIQLSTTTQFGKLIDLPANETHFESPRDIYSANKCVSEKYTLVYANAFDLNAAVLRLSNCYGPKACVSNKELTFNNYFIGLALNDQPITIYGSGSQMRNLIYIDDVVSAIDSLISSRSNFKETYLLVNDEHLSVKDIAEIIINECGSGSLIEIPWPKSTKKVEVGNQIFSNKKIKDKLGWKPQVKFSHGIKKTISFYRKYKWYYSS